MSTTAAELNGRDQRHHSSRSTKAPAPPAFGDNRPVIRLLVGQLEPTVDEAEQALIDADRGIYQRANCIVGVGAAPVITADRKRISARQILPLGEHRLLELLMSAAHFEKWDGRTGDFVPTNAPMTIVKALEQRCGHFRFPPLTGLISSPTLRSDGSVLSTPGYDHLTGLLFEPGNDAFPPVPERPTRGDAERALQIIEEILVDFPFVSDSDRAVAIAAVLTACVRRSLRTAPAFVFTAPVAGSGKSKLVDLASVIASGREAGVMAQGKDEGETEKRIAALLLSGSPIAIDNVEAGVGGDLLCQILTQTSVRMRVLGKSETPELPTNVLVTATGNNVSVLGDMTRRSLICRLDPGVERPELRQFTFEPVQQVMTSRGVYLVAALTVLRAFHVAGRPRQSAPLGSFEEWSTLVRDALLWLGRADPVATMEHGRSGDPRLEQLRAVMLQWHEVIGPTSIGASDVAQRASERERSVYDSKGEFKHPAFREALMAVAGEAGFISPTRLGRWLGKTMGRVVDGLRFDKAASHAGIIKWCLTDMVGLVGSGGVPQAKRGKVSE